MEHLTDTTEEKSEQLASTKDRQHSPETDSLIETINHALGKESIPDPASDRTESCPLHANNERLSQSEPQNDDRNCLDLNGLHDQAARNRDVQAANEAHTNSIIETIEELHGEIIRKTSQFNATSAGPPSPTSSCSSLGMENEALSNSIMEAVEDVFSEINEASEPGARPLASTKSSLQMENEAHTKSIIAALGEVFGEISDTGPAITGTSLKMKNRAHTISVITAIREVFNEIHEASPDDAAAAYSSSSLIQAFQEIFSEIEESEQIEEATEIPSSTRSGSRLRMENDAHTNEIVAAFKEVFSEINKPDRLKAATGFPPSTSSRSRLETENDAHTSAVVEAFEEIFSKINESNRLKATAELLSSTCSNFRLKMENEAHTSSIVEAFEEIFSEINESGRLGGNAAPLERSVVRRYNSVSSLAGGKSEPPAQRSPVSTQFERAYNRNLRAYVVQDGWKTPQESLGSITFQNSAGSTQPTVQEREPVSGETSKSAGMHASAKFPPFDHQKDRTPECPRDPGSENIKTTRSQHPAASLEERKDVAERNGTHWASCAAIQTGVRAIKLAKTSNDINRMISSTSDLLNKFYGIRETYASRFRLGEESTARSEARNDRPSNGSTPCATQNQRTSSAAGATNGGKSASPNAPSDRKLTTEELAELRSSLVFKENVPKKGRRTPEERKLSSKTGADVSRSRKLTAEELDELKSYLSSKADQAQSDRLAAERLIELKSCTENPAAYLDRCLARADSGVSRDERGRDLAGPSFSGRAAGNGTAAPSKAAIASGREGAVKPREMFVRGSSLSIENRCGAEQEPVASGKPVAAGASELILDSLVSAFSNIVDPPKKNAGRKPPAKKNALGKAPSKKFKTSPLKRPENKSVDDGVQRKLNVWDVSSLTKPRPADIITRSINNLVGWMSQIADSTRDTRVCWDSSIDSVPTNPAEGFDEVQEEIVKKSRQVVKKMTDTLLKTLGNHADDLDFKVVDDFEPQTQMSLGDNLSPSESRADGPFPSAHSLRQNWSTSNQLENVISRLLLTSSSPAARNPPGARSEIPDNVKKSLHKRATLENIAALLKGIDQTCRSRTNNVESDDPIELPEGRWRCMEPLSDAVEATSSSSLDALQRSLMTLSSHRSIGSTAKPSPQSNAGARKSSTSPIKRRASSVKSDVWTRLFAAAPKKARKSSTVLPTRQSRVRVSPRKLAVAATSSRLSHCALCDEKLQSQPRPIKSSAAPASRTESFGDLVERRTRSPSVESRSVSSELVPVRPILSKRDARGETERSTAPDGIDVKGSKQKRVSFCDVPESQLQQRIEISLQSPADVLPRPPGDIPSRCPAEFSLQSPAKTPPSSAVDVSLQLSAEILAPSPVEVSLQIPVEIPPPAKVLPPSTLQISPQIPIEMSSQIPIEMSSQLPIEISPQLPAEIPTSSPAEVSPQSPAEIPPPSPLEISSQLPIEISSQFPAEISPRSPAEVSPQSPAEIPPPSPLELSPQTPVECRLQSPVASQSLPIEPSPPPSTAPNPDPPSEKRRSPSPNGFHPRACEEACFSFEAAAPTEAKPHRQRLPSVFERLSLPKPPRPSDRHHVAASTQARCFDVKVSAPRLPSFDAATKQAKCSAPMPSVFERLSSPRLSRCSVTNVSASRPSNFNGPTKRAMGTGRMPSVFERLSSPRLSRCSVTNVAAPRQPNFNGPAKRDRTRMPSVFERLSSPRLSRCSVTNVSAPRPSNFNGPTKRARVTARMPSVFERLSKLPSCSSDKASDPWNLDGQAKRTRRSTRHPNVFERLSNPKLSRCAAAKASASRQPSFDGWTKQARCVPRSPKVTAARTAGSWMPGSSKGFAVGTLERVLAAQTRSSYRDAQDNGWRPRTPVGQTSQCSEKQIHAAF